MVICNNVPPYLDELIAATRGKSHARSVGISRGSHKQFLLLMIGGPCYSINPHMVAHQPVYIPKALCTLWTIDISEDQKAEEVGYLYIWLLRWHHLQNHRLAPVHTGEERRLHCSLRHKHIFSIKALTSFHFLKEEGFTDQITHGRDSCRASPTSCWQLASRWSLFCRRSSWQGAPLQTWGCSNRPSKQPPHAFCEKGVTEWLTNDPIVFHYTPL